LGVLGAEWRLLNFPCFWHSNSNNSMGTISSNTSSINNTRLPEAFTQ
jgi:hypothetical protein